MVLNMLLLRTQMLHVLLTITVVEGVDDVYADAVGAVAESALGERLSPKALTESAVAAVTVALKAGCAGCV